MIISKLLLADIVNDSYEAVNVFEGLDGNKYMFKSAGNGSRQMGVSEDGRFVAFTGYCKWYSDKQIALDPTKETECEKVIYDKSKKLHNMQFMIYKTS